LIAADAVLTAAHCLMNRRSGEWLNPEDVVFVAGLRRDQDLGFARGREILHSAHDINPRRPVLEDIGDDWAVLYLDRALAVQPIPIKVLPPEKQPAARLMLAGYSQERPYMLSLQDGCGVLERVDGDRVLLTDCDSTHGDSGSPLLIKKGKNIWIVGVASAIIVRGAAVGSYAVSASSFFGQTARVK
jgi:protease YdgD